MFNRATAKETTMNKTGFCIGLLVVSFLTPIPACADEWPRRAVRVIVPFAAASGPDFAARLFADRLSQRWKQPVVVENRPGADGLIGTAAFVGLRDDHVLMFSAAAPLSVLPVLQPKLPYDPASDVVPIASAADTFGAVAVSASLNIGSLEQLVVLARSRPGQINYHALAGAFPIVFAGFARSAGIGMVHVTYRETNAAVLDLAEGRIQVMLGTLPPLLPQVTAQKVRLLAVTNKMRSPIMPAIPTVMEAGYPSLSYDSFAGFFGPRDMPVERRNLISADVRAVAGEPAVADRLAAVGQVARSGTPAEFSAAIEEQRDRISSLAKWIETKPAQ
jgi:tripartite-type tricarboxylate transporter receptor subunit TctC